jgi:ribosomal protein S18 acetylase RimI-like enzyme
VNDYSAIRFEIDAAHRSHQLENEIIAWGISCVQKRNAATGENDPLHASFKATHTWQIALLERHEFVRDAFRTLGYSRSLNNPIAPHPLPPDFTLRCVAGEHEVEQLVTLHRAAFGTENMKVAHRLAIMQAPHYERELDLVAVAPNGELAAFCICGVEDGEDSERIGFTDPIGTHPNYQQRGLAKAMVTAGLLLLQEKGVARAQLSTGNNNIPMQRLAESLGFACISEKLWFSKEVTEKLV